MKEFRVDRALRWSDMEAMPQALPMLRPAPWPAASESMT
jgi:hypothetical protein